MAVSREMVFQEALELEESDRAELAAQLLDSPDPKIHENVEQAWLQEIDRRVAESQQEHRSSPHWIREGRDFQLDGSLKPILRQAAAQAHT